MHTSTITALVVWSLLGACSPPADTKGPVGSGDPEDTDSGGATSDTGDTGGTDDPVVSYTGEPGTFDWIFEHNGVERHTILYVPESYTVGPGTPLVINFHGFGQENEGQLKRADMRELAERDAVIVAYPAGTMLDGQLHWNNSLPSDDNESTADDFGFVEMLIDTISDSYDLDTSRVYAVGFSNGGMMSYALACFRSDLVAAIGSVAGAMKDDAYYGCQPEHPTSVIILHGAQDPDLPYSGEEGVPSVQDVVDYWVGFDQTGTTAATGVDSSGGGTVERLSYKGGTGGVAVEHYRYVEGVHEWFDETYEGSDATTLVWDFVTRFDRRGAL